MTDRDPVDGLALRAHAPHRQMVPCPVGRGVRRQQDRRRRAPDPAPGRRRRTRGGRRRDSELVAHARSPGLNDLTKELLDLEKESDGLMNKLIG